MRDQDEAEELLEETHYVPRFPGNNWIDTEKPLRLFLMESDGNLFACFRS